MIDSPTARPTPAGTDADALDFERAYGVYRVFGPPEHLSTRRNRGMRRRL